ncbi:blastula protease 10-like [Tachypleus tridentatus]|uniref:blastula protease 10-like n=1 Tax=Tachypleus tridentatus TaxID=6853 RepID=UPI003FD0E958
MRLKFFSDFSYSKKGFRAEVHLWNESISSEVQCENRTFYLFDDQCFLVVSYPEVSWYTARDICVESQARLVTFHNQQEIELVNQLIQSTETSVSGFLYWIGATKEAGANNWHWIDGLQINQSELTEITENIRPENSSECLSLRWRTWNNISDLYWTSSACHQPGRYICKKSAVVLPQNLNQTFQGTYGTISSINFPQHYPNNLKYTLTIKSTPLTRIYVRFTHLVLEEQEQCLYDYISLQSDLNGPETRICGQHQNDLNKFLFFSDNNTAFLTFHSDYSITASGFQATWKAVDISACREIQHITVTHKITYTSNNYPERYLPNLHCVAQFQAPRNKILLTFFDIDVGISEGSTGCKRDYIKSYFRIRAISEIHTSVWQQQLYRTRIPDLVL